MLILSQVVLSSNCPSRRAVVMFTSDRTKMGRFVNPAWLKVGAWLISAVIIALNLKLLTDILL